MFFDIGVLFVWFALVFVLVLLLVLIFYRGCSGRRNSPCLYGLIWCLVAFFAQCMVKCMDFKNKMNPKKNQSKVTRNYSQHCT